MKTVKTVKQFKSDKKVRPGVHKTFFELPTDATNEQIAAAARIVKRQKTPIIEMGIIK